ncbi:hypothetical protein F2Q70_00012565 [Brassica cretica]|uniref:Uncharacterized protein n=1 Tax=Brassica cretica TaxID=69181 RepID=A0A8S9MC11_BRACR|nr:hypothetical protein F2Q70_00012565 [Brassica cretica]
MQLDTQKHEVSQYLRSAHANRHAEARVSRRMNPRHAESYVYVVMSPGIVYLVLVLLCENLVVFLVVVCRSLLPQMPPASPIEDRGTAIPIEDRDRTITERLRNPGSLSETSSLTPHILLQIPLEMKIREGSDEGVRVVVSSPGSVVSKAYEDLAQNVLNGPKELHDNPENEIQMKLNVSHSS